MAKCQDLLCANYKEFGWFEFTRRSKHSLKTFSVRELDSCKTCYMHYARVSWNVSSIGTNIKVWKNQRFLNMSCLISIFENKVYIIPIFIKFLTTKVRFKQIIWCLGGDSNVLILLESNPINQNTVLKAWKYNLRSNPCQF